MTSEEWTADTPGTTGPLVPATVASPPVARTRRWLPILLAGVGVLVIGGAAGAWWWFRRVPVDPPFPAEVNDPAVRSVLDEARRQVQADPQSAAAWGQLGMTLHAHTYGAEADRCFAEATRLDPGDGRWPYLRALIALGEDSDRAMPFLRQAAAGRLSEEHESAVRLRLAEALLERQELAEAEELFLADWRDHQGNPRASFGLGLIALARGDEAAAEKYLTAARASPVVRKPATAQLAALARGRGDVAAAVAFEKEFATLPNEAPAWPDPMVLQLLRLRVGTFKTAQDAVQLEAQHRYAEAAQAYLQQIEHQATAQNYVGAGLNLVRSGELARGLNLLKTGIRLDPERCDSHYALAQACYLLAEAQRKRSPDSREANDRFLEAALAARRATELKPDHAAAFLLWGRALMQRGEPDAAIISLKKGVACRPEVFNLQLALGEALLEAGQLQEAEIHLKNALKLDAKNERPALALERLRQRKE
jgi:tetratricopeptide (TPR) repeat protein